MGYAGPPAAGRQTMPSGGLWGRWGSAGPWEPSGSKAGRWGRCAVRPWPRGLGRVQSPPGVGDCGRAGFRAARARPGDGLGALCADGRRDQRQEACGLCHAHAAPQDLLPHHEPLPHEAPCWLLRVEAWPGAVGSAPPSRAQSHPSALVSPDAQAGGGGSAGAGLRAWTPGAGAGRVPVTEILLRLSLCDPPQPGGQGSGGLRPWVTGCFPRLSRSRANGRSRLLGTEW